MSAQKEHGIIMSGEHPLNVLNKTKTQTRRMWGLKEINQHPDDWELVAVFQDGCARFCAHDGSQELTVKCPYGGYGDGLWVKETLYRNPYFDEAGYLIDNTPVMINSTIGDMLKWQWKKDILPAMFMPREASRILLEITEVRVERLQEITVGDVKREGVAEKPEEEFTAYVHYPIIERFQLLWDSLNAKKYPWSSNPWVWVISFKIL